MEGTRKEDSPPPLPLDTISNGRYTEGGLPPPRSLQIVCMEGAEKIEQENTEKGWEEGERKVRICPLLFPSLFLSSAFSPPAVSIYQFAFHFVDFELY